MDTEKAQATAGRKLIIEARMKDHYLDAKGRPVWHKLANFKRDKNNTVVEEDGKRTLIGGEKYYSGKGGPTIILNFTSWTQLPDSEGGARFVEAWLNSEKKQNEVEIRRRYVDVTLKSFLSNPRIPMPDVAGDLPISGDKPARKKPGPKPKDKSGSSVAEAR